MPKFLYPTGSVYVLENLLAQRVKVGMTGIGVNDVASRLNDINDMWMERKVTCQVCGGRLVHDGGNVPSHVKSGITCNGGSAPPVERSVTLAKLQLAMTLDSISELQGSEKGSATRIAKTLARRIEKYSYPTQREGFWQFRVAFYTKGVAEVEALAHKKLAAYLDTAAPFGEVFCCSASEAIEAIEAALRELEVMDSAQLRRQLM